MKKIIIAALFAASIIISAFAANLSKLRLKIMDNFKKEFGAMDVEESNVLKSAPKGYDPNHPAIDFLKLKSFTVSQKIDDKLFLDKDFARKIAQKLIVIKPLNDFLNRGLETEE